MNLNDMTQQEFDELLAEVKENTPNLFQFIEDFIDKKVTREEVCVYLSMTSDQQQNYIDNYQAR
ncbi:hypothetical protein JavanS592_0006 [Streptococcus satellite phage Javan592]|nr:hypothetical protein T15_1589 [Streptococcus suis T15]MBO8082518.1 hypothetical protein [Streptococcus suis]QBX11234.1 hypothetical protein JavanS550_0011 [Streptococcus satellite phage Javan550]QBX11387.1 hypothetical protein JavanS564_0011 [Streptococcus satellite phage Javan564]QBX11432.1 hypothetical protein JavanS572_0007 [Streptococcus satellite phage Javan572]QBX11561.1 hypothetical protein JavanS592_0006 [Streptococcus satellite phage Javan592]